MSVGFESQAGFKHIQVRIFETGMEKHLPDKFWRGSVSRM